MNVSVSQSWVKDAERAMAERASLIEAIQCSKEALDSFVWNMGVQGTILFQTRLQLALAAIDRTGLFELKNRSDK